MTLFIYLQIQQELEVPDMWILAYLNNLKSNVFSNYQHHYGDDVPLWSQHLVGRLLEV